MAIKRNKRFHVEVATSALSDIMFFLLLFFLIISTLANPNVIKMTLPKAEQNDQQGKQMLSISVTQDEAKMKHYFIDKEEVSFEELETKILANLSGSKDQSIVVRIPFDLQVQDLIDVLQIAVRNNLKFVIATSPK
jgi:biopolymer transport protein ExbD